MKHLVLTQFGTPSESVALHDDRDPVPGPGDVLVHMEAAAVNPSDPRSHVSEAPAPPYRLTGRGLPQHARSHSCTSATFSRPSSLAASRLFASVPPCSVSKSVATILSGKSNRLGVLRCKPGAASSGSTRGVKLTRRSRVLFWDSLA